MGKKREEDEFGNLSGVEFSFPPTMEKPGNKPLKKTSSFMILHTTPEIKDIMHAASAAQHIAPTIMQKHGSESGDLTISLEDASI